MKEKGYSAYPLIITVVFFGLTFLFCTPLFSQADMKQLTEMYRNNRLNRFKQKISYDDAIKNEILFFIYKNVVVEVRRSNALLGHEDFGEVLAEWLVNALK